MEQQKYLERKDERMMRRREREASGGFGLWSAVGGMALLGVAALVYTALPDIRRYIKISRM